MATQFETESLRRRQNLPRLLDVEIAALAKHIAKFRQFFFCDERQHFVDHKIDIFARGTAAWDSVSPEKCRDDFKRCFIV